MYCFVWCWSASRVNNHVYINDYPNVGSIELVYYTVLSVMTKCRQKKTTTNAAVRWVEWSNLYQTTEILLYNLAIKSNTNNNTLSDLPREICWDLLPPCSALLVGIPRNTVSTLVVLKHYIIPGYEIVGFACVWSCIHDHTCWSC